jgi:hypothetical protein
MEELKLGKGERSEGEGRLPIRLCTIASFGQGEGGGRIRRLRRKIWGEGSQRVRMAGGRNTRGKAR